MRHRVHSHQLGVKTAHRKALVANLASQLIEHGRINTTLAKAKALRPFIEKIITLAKKAQKEGGAKAVHYRRVAISRVRNKAAIQKLFNERVTEFTDREGGYTRIYKLAPRLSDAAAMAIIEFVDAADEGYGKRGSKKKSTSAKKKTASKSKSTAEKAESSEGEEPKAKAATTKAASKAEPAKKETAATKKATTKKTTAKKTTTKKAAAKKTDSKEK